MRKGLADTKEAAKAAEKTADTGRQALIADHRAWIKIKHISIAMEKIASPDAVGIGISMGIMNVGNAPAMKIRTVMNAVALGPREPFSFSDHRERLSELFGTSLGSGFVLFPGEGFPNEEIWHQTVMLRRPQIPNAGVVNLYVIGRVDYTFPTDEKGYHQTGFMFQVAPKAGGQLIIPDDEAIPIDELMVRELDLGRKVT
jgi:hypothetical protein